MSRRICTWHVPTISEDVAFLTHTFGWCVLKCSLLIAKRRGGLQVFLIKISSTMLNTELPSGCECRTQIDWRLCVCL